MQIRRRELLGLIGFALAACKAETPDARRQTPEEAGRGPAGNTRRSTSETPDARRQTPEGTQAPSTTSPPTTTTAGNRTIEVIERAGWGAAEANQGMVGHTIERLTIHHTGVELDDNRQAPSRLRAHQRFHQTDRAWPDLAYHFAVDREGNIYEGRSPEFAGDTATSYDPAGHLLVVLEGNFDTETVAGPQLGSLTELLAWATGQYSVGVDTIKSHRDYAPETSCPGANLYDLLLSGELVEAVTTSLGEELMELVYLRGVEALDRIAIIESA